MEQDFFAAYLQGKMGESAWRTRALRDRSMMFKLGLPECQVNHELATYGDAVLKLAYCEILLDAVDDLTIEKSKYESDVALIRVAKHYDLLQYLEFDRSSTQIPQDYRCKRIDPSFSQSKRMHIRKFNRKRKYIATAIEAVLGAIYKEYRDFGQIVKIVENWKHIIEAEISSDPSNTEE